MFKVNNKDTRTTFTSFFNVSIDDFEQVNVCYFRTCQEFYITITMSFQIYSDVLTFISFIFISSDMRTISRKNYVLARGSLANF